MESSRAEALNAVEFYNRPNGRRPLEALLVHMHLAWLYLLQAEFVRDGTKYFYRDPKNPLRYSKVDGERKAWDLERSVKERWPLDKDPVRNNIELTIKLRNKIEHRYEPGLMVASAGFCQALVLNYEEELTSQFGSTASLGTAVHMPVSLGTFTREGAANLLAAQAALPQRLKDFFVGFRSTLGDELASDRRFEFRVELIQKRAPKTDADLAISFVREDLLSPAELRAYEELERTGRVVIREKERPVANLERYRPAALSSRVQDRIPFRFRPSAEFPRGWKNLGVRPASSVKGAARRQTDERYCVYDAAHDDYVYTAAYADLLIKECSTVEGFTRLLGCKPTPKPVEIPAGD